MGDFDVLIIDERLKAASLQPQDAIAIDREIAKAFGEWAAWRARTVAAPEADDTPFFRYESVTRRKLFDDIKALGETDPLVPCIRRAVYRLADARINGRVVQAIEYERRERRHALESPERGNFALRQMLMNALSDAPARQAWCDSYLGNGEELSKLVSLLWQRRAEHASRWGLSHASEFEYAGMPVIEVAKAWLTQTQDMASESSQRTLGAFLEQTTGADAGLEWPSRLNWRMLADLFRDSELLASLSLSAKHLPEKLVPASFMRGLERLGVEWAAALRPQDQPFVIAHDPYRLNAHVHGGLFATLFTNPSFLKRKFGATADRLRVAQRTLARVILLESRVRAHKLLLREYAIAGHKAFAEANEAMVLAHFGVELRGAPCGTLWAPQEEDAQRFAGLMLALLRSSELMLHHDEDWFRNPRAVDELRSNASLPPQITVEAAALNRGASELFLQLTRMLA